MPAPPVYKYRVRAVNEDGITLNKIVLTPRRYKPQDLLAACHNTSIELTEGQPTKPVETLVHYIFNEFFVFEHRTGLYNRQKNMWESLSRVASVSVFQRKSGVFSRKEVPLFDILCLDYRDRPLVYAHLIDPEYAVTDKNCSKLLNAAVGKASRLGGLLGVVLCCPSPVPDKLVAQISKMVGSEDPVGRYESLLPQQRIPLDLVEMVMPEPQSELEGAAPQQPWIRLVHPDLTVVRKPKPTPAGTTAS